MNKRGEGGAITGEAPAWLLCYDMLIKVKDELTLEAIDILHDEIKAKHIDITGYVSLLPDKSDELQRDMYIINNLLIRENEIREQYAAYLEDSSGTTDGKELARAEELKRFLLALDAISMLMGYSRLVAKWAEDTGEFYDSSDPAEIVRRTMEPEGQRRQLAEYILSSAKFRKSDALSEDEFEIIRRSLRS
ncbi:MAG: hypothetical protein KGH72_01705 [Candidatus Micrarchaeota archaeon]|nr:hypothetical protein [Candidatus Micrarchaeota archaeon]